MLKKPLNLRLPLIRCSLKYMYNSFKHMGNKINAPYLDSHLNLKKFAELNFERLRNISSEITNGLNAQNNLFLVKEDALNKDGELVKRVHHAFRIEGRYYTFTHGKYVEHLGAETIETPIYSDFTSPQEEFIGTPNYLSTEEIEARKAGGIRKLGSQFLIRDDTEEGVEFSQLDYSTDRAKFFLSSLGLKERLPDLLFSVCVRHHMSFVPPINPSHDGLDFNGVDKSQAHKEFMDLVDRKLDMNSFMTFL